MRSVIYSSAPKSISMEELDEFNAALRELWKAAHELYEQEKATERSMNKVVNESNLRSVLTLFKEDFLVRDLLGRQTK